MVWRGFTVARFRLAKVSLQVGNTTEIVKGAAALASKDCSSRRWVDGRWGRL